MTKPGAGIIAVPYLDGDRREHLTAPYGATIMECVEMALPGLPREALATYARVTLEGELVDPSYWTRVRLTPRNDNLPVLVIRVAPGNSGTFRAVLSIAVSVAALSLGQVWAAPLAAAAGFGGSAIATSVAGGLITATTLIAGTLLINSLVPVRQDQSQGSGLSQSPTYSVTGLRNVANPDGVIPYVFGRVRFAPPYAALPYTEEANGETYVRAAFLLGPGPVEISDIRLGDTPIEKFKEVEYEVREGYDADLPLTLYTKQVLEERMTTELSLAYATTYGAHTRFTAADVTEAEVAIAFPSGLFWMAQVGSPPRPQPVALTIGFRISYRLEGLGAWTIAADLPISAFTQKAITVPYRWSFPSRGRYEVKVERITQDFDDLNAFDPNNQFVSISIWSAFRSFRPEYPLNFDKPLALIAVRIKGSKQLNGVIENLSADVSRIALDWDGAAWVEQETNNPASMLRWGMQGPGMAYPIVDGEVDLANLEDWHDFCADKGLQFNRVVDYETSAFDVWSDIAAAGRAAVRNDGEKWGVVIDRPQTVVMQHITPRNSHDFSGSRDYPKFPHGFRVSFNDETNFHKPTERVVPWPGFGGQPVITESISFPGITDPDLIYREARRRMYELIYRRDTWTVMMDFEGALARRGDLVKLSHDVLLSTQVAGRVKVVLTNGVMLDTSVTMETGTTYALRFRTAGPDDSTPDVSVLRAVTTVAGETDVIFFSDTGTLPDVGDLCMFGESGEESFDCIVKEVEGAENLGRRLTLIPHAPEIHTTADGKTPPAWNGRVGDEIGVGPSLSFDNSTNSQYLILGVP
jgi:hypothetical protein